MINIISNSSYEKLYTFNKIKISKETLNTIILNNNTEVYEYLSKNNLLCFTKKELGFIYSLIDLAIGYGTSDFKFDKIIDDNKELFEDVDNILEQQNTNDNADANENTADDYNIKYITYCIYSNIYDVSRFYNIETIKKLIDIIPPQILKNTKIVNRNLYQLNEKCNYIPDVINYIIQKFLKYYSIEDLNDSTIAIIKNIKHIYKESDYKSIELYMTIVQIYK